MLKKLASLDNRTVYIGLHKASKATHRWIVHIPESGAGLYKGHRSELAELIGSPLSHHFHYLVVNKSGLSPSGRDSPGFEKAFRRETRLADALLAMKTFIPKQDNIYLIGYSEGAYLAPQIARRDARVTGMTLIGGGTRGWLKEELNNARGPERLRVRKEIERIRKSPRSEKKWNGFSYATWYSYRGDDTLKDLKTLGRVQVLALLGTRDQTIDLKTTVSDLRQLKQKIPINVHLLSRCGHTFASHWPEVRKRIRSVLESG